MERNLNISDAADLIISAPFPVIMLDTCILLDIIRAPIENTNYCIRPARTIANNAYGPTPSIYIVASDQVLTEWDANHERVARSLESHINTLDRHLTQANQALTLSGLTSISHPTQLSSLGLHGSLKTISSQLLDNAIILQEDAECSLKASGRTRENRPPARKGGGLQDCYIIEHYIALCNQLQDVGFNKHLVFASSNTNDFCQKKPIMHDSLITEFPSNFQYATNLAWAEYLLNN